MMEVEGGLKFLLNVFHPPPLPQDHLYVRIAYAPLGLASVWMFVELEHVKLRLPRDRFEFRLIVERCL